MKKARTKAELEEALTKAKSARVAVDVHMSGALLQEITERIASGDINVSLKKVLACAQARADHAAFQRGLRQWLEGI